MANQKQNFNPKSPGAIYSLATLVLTILAGLGIGFPDSIANISGQLQTSIQGGSYFALIGIVGGSVLFPIWNLIQKKQKLNWANLFGSTANVTALAYAALGVIAMTGFYLPNGTVEQIQVAVEAKDWGALASIVVGTVLTALVRWFKDRKAATATV
jgi:hypothetical protein